MFFLCKSNINLIIQNLKMVFKHCLANFNLCLFLVLCCKRSKILYVQNKFRIKFLAVLMQFLRFMHCISRRYFPACFDLCDFAVMHECCCSSKLYCVGAMQLLLDCNKPKKKLKETNEKRKKNAKLQKKLQQAKSKQ